MNTKKDYLFNYPEGMTPCIALEDHVVFPTIPATVEINDEGEIEICEQVYENGEEIFLVLRRLPPSDFFLHSDNELFSVGCIGKITHIEKTDNGIAIVFVGEGRARILGSKFALHAVQICRMRERNRDFEREPKDDVRISICKKYFKELTKLIPRFPEDLRNEILDEPSLSRLVDRMAFSSLVSPGHKQQILEESDVKKRLELFEDLSAEELNQVYNELDLHKKVKRMIDGDQREYFLREQLKAIKEELGESNSQQSPNNLFDDAEDDDELVEYRKKVIAQHFPRDVQEKLLKEVGKLAKTPYSSAESTVIRNYIDTCLEIPFSKKSKDVTSVEKARAQLEKDHYGLEKVKERILEYIAVKQLNPDIKNQIICLVGAPGVGKTSIVSSIAKAMGREYVRVSLGGVKDEADIRGHRKTYVASMPGRIVAALIQAKVKNPVVLLDEIDKLSNDFKGDPASALLEVLDSEQNKAFRDHFVEIPVDLSECVFIATANSLEHVARPLIDRMEIIELPIYNRREKFEIAKGFLFPKQLSRHGMTKRQLKIDDEVYYEIADNYTHEAGVRNLEREISSLCRKAAKKIVDGEKSIHITVENLTDFAGQRKIIPDRIYDRDEIGTVNGLAYTELGGEMLRVEAIAMDGSGKTQFTGSLGDVMKESAQIAVSYIRMHAKELGIDGEFYKNKDLHIHFPEGAVPKDGPSAGVALCSAILSELGSYKARRDVAMTGEITLHGRVLPIGGLKEKTMAAYKAGVTTVLLPEDNRKDLPELDASVRENINFVFCKTLSDVFANALIMPGQLS